MIVSVSLHSRIMEEVHSSCFGGEWRIYGLLRWFVGW